MRNSIPNTLPDTKGIRNKSIRTETLAHYLMQDLIGPIDKEHFRVVERAVEQHPEILERVTNEASGRLKSSLLTGIFTVSLPTLVQR
jgi:hypothetical protein